ncbi:unnamed protein product [Rangifer tarandus platyrhynchus]|uniref:Uncharacterized protein n=1 Tax=Rangifer tarandus platyrhynchus TaxID=3082113 RepID=A0AC59Z7K9_RANTA
MLWSERVHWIEGNVVNHELPYCRHSWWHDDIRGSPALTSSPSPDSRRILPLRPAPSPFLGAQPQVSGQRSGPLTRPLQHSPFPGPARQSFNLN